MHEISRLIENEYRFAVTQAVLVRSFNNDVYRIAQKLVRGETMRHQGRLDCTL